MNAQPQPQQPLSKAQQRELLALQAELARLKIRSEQLRQQGRNRAGKPIDWLKLADSLPLAMLLWQAAVLPAPKQRQLLPKFGRLLWRWWSSEPEKGKKGKEIAGLVVKAT